MRIHRPLAFFLVSAATLTTAGSAHAQLYGPDPYDPDGRPFKAYAYPGAGEVYGGMSGRARTQGAYNSPNQFDRADDDLGFPATGLGARLGGRYDSAYRRQDRDYGREYIPNEQADKKYVAAREKREREMMRAMTERDPKKREKLIKEAEDSARKGSSDVGLSVRRGNTSGQVIASRAPVRTSRIGSTGGPSSDTKLPVVPARRSRLDGTPASNTAAPANRAPTRSSAGSNREGTVPIPPSTRRQAGDGTGAASKPSEVLERSRNMDRDRPKTTSTRRQPNTP